jgi:hypothetical protein
MLFMMYIIIQVDAMLFMTYIMIQVEPRTLSTKRPNGYRQPYLDHIFKVHTSAPFSKVNKKG